MITGVLACDCGNTAATNCPKDLRLSRTQPWSVPLNLGPVVNTAAGESRSALSFDTKHLYIISNRPGGVGNLDF
jgi:hypothetical protein